MLYHPMDVQPALLYLVPSCIGIPAAAAMCRGEFKTLFSYSEEDEASAAPEKDAASVGKKLK